MIRFHFFIYFLISGISLNSQVGDSMLYVLKKAEAELHNIEKGFLSRSEKERIETNKQFIATWDKIIGSHDILNFSFDSLKEVSIIRPENRKFMLITWNLHRDDGTHNYFGYLLVNNSKTIKKGWFKKELINEYEHFKLIDVSATIKNPETYVGYPNKWFGMLYYDMVECDGYYTLLGYDPNDKLVRRKFVDALYFKSDGTPVFGKDVFRFPKKNPKRLMFEYSSEVSMSMKYNDKRHMIIYSHLGPAKEGDLLQGLPQFYGPDGSYDGLEMRKDKWEVVEDVETKNEKSKTDNLWNDPKKPSNKKHKKVLPANKQK